MWQKAVRKFETYWIIGSRYKTDHIWQFLLRMRFSNAAELVKKKKNEIELDYANDVNQ